MVMAMSHYDDTIYALSSGGLPSGVAVVRVSGARAFSSCTELLGELPAPRRAALRTIRTRNGLDLDRALVIAFPGPKSFTGEDCVEYQLHGGKAVVRTLLAELASFVGHRHAEAGEFSRRAFDNGKLDLVEVEGLADLIAAETEMQRRLAIEQTSGGLSSLYRGWATRLTRARAMIEAELDFADEEDVPGSVSELIWEDMAALQAEMRTHLDAGNVSEIIRDGFHVVIAGPPNAGKSSLMNALAKRDVAIVTDVAGTTRDVLSLDLDIGGYAVRLQDTAGLRATEELVEQEGIRRALSAIEEADLILYLEEIDTDPGTELPFDGGASLLRIGTKLDLHREAVTTKFDVALSTASGQNLDLLLDLIRRSVIKRTDIRSTAAPARLRHIDQLQQAEKQLSNAISETTAGIELRAESLRNAAHSLGRITGNVDVENLLDVIFSEFCIGK